MKSCRLMVAWPSSATLSPKVWCDPVRSPAASAAAYHLVEKICGNRFHLRSISTGVFRCVKPIAGNGYGHSHTCGAAGLDADDLSPATQAHPVPWIHMFQD